MFLSFVVLLLSVASTSSNDDMIEELDTLRRKVRLMDVVQAQMEEKGRQLTVKLDLTERELRKKSEELEHLEEIMLIGGGGTGKNSGKEGSGDGSGDGSDGGGSGGIDGPRDKSKIIRDLQGKVGSLNLKLGIANSQLDKCKSQLKTALNGSEPAETSEERRRHYPHYACEVHAVDLKRPISVDALYEAPSEEQRASSSSAAAADARAKANSTSSEEGRENMAMMPLVTRDAHFLKHRWGKNRFGEKCKVEMGDALVGAGMSTHAPLRMSEFSIQELIARAFEKSEYYAAAESADRTTSSSASSSFRSGDSKRMRHDAPLRGMFPLVGVVKNEFGELPRPGHAATASARLQSANKSFLPSYEAAAELAVDMDNFFMDSSVDGTSLENKELTQPPPPPLLEEQNIAYDRKQTESGYHLKGFLDVQVLMLQDFERGAMTMEKKRRQYWHRLKIKNEGFDRYKVYDDYDKMQVRGDLPFHGTKGLHLLFEAPEGTLHRAELDVKFAADEVIRLEEEARKAKEEEARQAALDEEQRLREEAERRHAMERAVEEARIEEERQAERQALERKRKAEEEIKAAADFELTQHEKWRRAGFDFDFKVVLTEQVMAAAGYSIGISFLPNAPVVRDVRVGSIGEQNRIFAGDRLMQINGQQVDTMPTEVMIRTLTLAEFPRILQFYVPKKYSTSEDDGSDEADVDNLEQDDDEDGDKDEAEQDDGNGDASDASREIDDQSKVQPPPPRPFAWRTPRPQRQVPKKKPDALVLRITEPALASGEYEVRLAKWSGWFDGPLVEDEEEDEGAQDGAAAGDSVEKVWPCMPLELTTTDPNSGCAGARLAIPHRNTRVTSGNADDALLDMAVQRECVKVNESSSLHDGIMEICDTNKYPLKEELPMIVVAMRGTCTFTDKVRALQGYKHPIWNDELMAAAVVINTENKPLDMPAGRARVDDLKHTMAVGMNSSAGSSLLEVLSFASRSEDLYTHALDYYQEKMNSADGPPKNMKPPTPPQRVRGWIGQIGECEELRSSPEFVPPPWLADSLAAHTDKNLPQRRPNDEGGKFVALTSFGDPLGPYTFHSALFGPSGRDRSAKHTANGNPVKLVVADPIDGCNVQTYKVRVKGFFAIVERGGGCGFGDKVIAAQTAGAVGVVVVNKGEGDKGKSQAMMADKDQSALVKVPAFMVSAALLEDIRDDELVRQIAKNKGTALHSNVRFGIVGRFIFEDFYGDYD